MQSHIMQWVVAVLCIVANFTPSDTVAPQHLCADPQFDTIFSTNDGKVYVFKGPFYWLLSPKTNDEGYKIANGYPQKISSTWRDLPSSIDTSFTNYEEGKTYFFKGDQHWRYKDQQLDVGYPKLISLDFPNVPNNLDVAFVCTRYNYFSKGDQVYNPHRTSSRPISSVWKNLPNDVTSAVQLPNAAHTYFFKGTKFYKLKRSTMTLEKANPSYPHNVDDFWLDCTNMIDFPLPQ